MPITPELGRGKPEDQKFKAIGHTSSEFGTSLADIRDLVLKKKREGGREERKIREESAKNLKFLEGEYNYRRELLRKREKFKVFDLPETKVSKVCHSVLLLF